MRKLLFLAILGLAPATADASCMQAEMSPTVLTRRDTHLPADGGVLVGYSFSTEDREQGNGPDPSDVKWNATSGKTKITLTRTELAPGLSVYRPAANVSAFKLTGPSGKDHGSFTHVVAAAPSATPMPAPDPKMTTSKMTEDFRSTSTTVKLTLRSAPPVDAVAIIAYDDSGKALLFAGLPDTHDKLLEFTIYATGGHCGTPHPNSEGSLAGKVTFAYVDAFGRLSAKSKSITVQ